MLPDNTNQPVFGQRRILIIAAIIIAVLAIITVSAVVTVVVLLRQPAPVVAPTSFTPTPVEAPPVIPAAPSKFASDAALLKLKSDVLGLTNRVNTIDLVEPEITPPNLDLRLEIVLQN